MINNNQDEFRKEYAKRSQDYKQLAFIAEDTLRDRLKSKNIKTAYVISRVKEEDNFIEKINRKKYSDPFGQMHDIVGVRVVCLYTEDMEKIAELICKEFESIGRDDKVESLGPDKMGYQDISFVVKLRVNGEALTRYPALAKYKFEIQVRSIMNDAAAIISHDLSYKKEPPLPNALQRELNLIFSALELTQYHCDRLREERKKYVKKIESVAQDSDQTNFLNQPIMDDTLRVYTKKLFPGLPIKEHIHSLILRDLNPDKYRKLADIDKAVKYSKEFVDHYKTQSDSFKSGSDYITKSLGYYDEDFLSRHPFAEKTKVAIGEYKKQRK
jgi:ppGpp synthetase/RelA/SpoT-type nucleotidyltranferase